MWVYIYLKKKKNKEASWIFSSNTKAIKIVP